MDAKIKEMLGKLPLDKETVTRLLPVLSRLGVQGALAVARSYLGPVAVQVERRQAYVRDGDTGAAGALKPSEMALLGTALTKLLFEAGELALHNPQLTSDGKQPEFKLDEDGSPPALSLAHLLAVNRVWQERTATQAAEQQAAAATAAERAKPVVLATPRARLLAARAERYAAATPQPVTFAATRYRAPR